MTFPNRGARLRRTLLGGAAVTALATSLAACGSDASSGGAAAAKTGGTLVIDTAFNAKSVDPARMFQPTDSIIQTGTYQTLLTYKGTDTTTPVKTSLTESFEFSDDATELTIQLNPKATFSDGTPVTAKDVVFSFDRLKNVKADPAFLTDGLSVKASGDHTVVFTADDPRPDLPAILCSTNLAVTNSKVIEANGGTDAKDAAKKDTAEAFLNKTSAGSGPYVLESYSTSGQIALKANPNAWDGKPPYDRIVVRNVQSSQQQQLNVESGESQVALDLSARQAETLDESRFAITSVNAPEVLYLAASQKKGAPTANPKLVEAIRKGIDYEQLLPVAGSAAARAAGLVPSGFLGALDPAEAAKYDPDAAKQLVEESGVGGATISLDYANDYHRLAGLDYGAVAQRIQSDLKKIGIAVKLEPTPTATSLQRYMDGEIQLALWSYPPDYGDPYNLLFFAPGTWMTDRIHWAKGADDEVTAAADKAAKATGAERAGALQEWQRTLADGPYVPLLEPSFTTVASPAVKNAVRNPVVGVSLAAVGR